MLINLLSNAVKYNSMQGSVTVTLAREEEKIRMAVIDTGIGIPKEKQTELFTQFNRLGRESGEIEGSGIGLALSKRLITLMDGAIGAESVPGTGSTFWITLPATQSFCPESERSAPGPERLSPTPMPYTQEPSTPLPAPRSERLSCCVAASPGLCPVATPRRYPTLTTPSRLTRQI